eukprot:gene11417-14588_t
MPHDGFERRAAACLYAALVADVALGLVGAQRTLLVEGRFAHAEVFVRALAGLRPDLAVHVAHADTDVAFGALRLIDPALAPPGGLECLDRCGRSAGACLMIVASIPDFREASRRRTPHFLFEYIDGGSYAEVTLRRNIADLEAIALRQRVLRDISRIDMTTELFGVKQALPVVLAPVGLAGMNARRGEVQAVRAANAAGVPFTLSTVSVCPIAEVAAASDRPFWFQLYMIRDRAFMKDLLVDRKSTRRRSLYSSGAD